MADTPTTTPGTHAAASSSIAKRPLLLDMADTTWRMFIPTVGLLMIGRHLDVRFATKPWLMLAGATLGACLAALLIRRQLSMTATQTGGETQ